MKLLSTQINGYVTAAERDAFRNYAESNLVGVSGLASLLVARCLHQAHNCRNLTISIEVAQSKTDSKITAHRLPEIAKREFEKLCQSLDLTESALLRFLCVSELNEQWLLKALTTHSESSIDSL